MPAHPITSDDLREFKLELLEAIQKLLTDPVSGGTKKYLKSGEVMKLLQISASTLQTLRINGTLPYSKMGGTLFYAVDDIERIMQDNKIQHSY
ncbi:helix-turn-helix domain-containing protein [Arenibacter sp. GZD96]|uniref:helix-turn-helix domain-containing protein n=1 Tax=Aurantibrevibacter litoralis TaxID=3106030 RepID=UPI002B031C8D|nr:helix-turn-helix domain-containing protein [Arenibacter sp. GZD-96]MEA1785438.1 helix-turn-helix domain-containing protein [Arenibacter sp. GZD-96]